jgi:hypothetical protein
MVAREVGEHPAPNVEPGALLEVVVAGERSERAD